MNRCRIFSLSAIAIWLALLSTSAVSQQKSLKDQLAGVWTLVSCDSTFPNGTKQPYCGNSNGLLVLDAGGRYAMMTAKRDRPKFTTPNRLEAPAEEFKAAAQGLVAQFGTWSVNDTDKTMTRHIEGALFPNIEGTDDSTSFSLAGDELKLTNNQPTSGGKLESVYRRDALGAARTPETLARARFEARISALHSGLQLTPEQESRWPAFEQAYRELAKLRFEPGGETPAADDPVARMERRADALTRRGAAVKALAEAVAPLWQSFSDGQKRRFAALARPFNFRLEFGARDERGGFGSDGDRYGFSRGPRDFAPDGPGRDGDLWPRGFGFGGPGREDDYGRGPQGFGSEGRGRDGEGDRYGFGPQRRFGARGYDGPGRDDYGYGERRGLGRRGGDDDYGRGPRSFGPQGRGRDGDGNRYGFGARRGFGQRGFDGPGRDDDYGYGERRGFRRQGSGRDDN
jgi:Lipocalin-like domain/LTXXQ motif family protein